MNDEPKPMRIIRDPYGAEPDRLISEEQYQRELAEQKEQSDQWRTVYTTEQMEKDYPMAMARWRRAHELWYVKAFWNIVFFGGIAAILFWVNSCNNSLIATVA